MVNTIDKTQHRRKRKIIGQALTDRSMRTFESIIESQINIFLRSLMRPEQENRAINMTERCQYLGLDIIGLLAFGYPLRTQSQDTFRFLPAAINSVGWRISLYMNFPFLAPFERLFVLLGIKQALKFQGLIKNMVKARIAQEKDAHYDLYSVVADHIGKDQEGLYHDELWPEAFLLIAAGMSHLSYAVYLNYFSARINYTVHENMRLSRTLDK